MIRGTFGLSAGMNVNSLVLDLYVIPLESVRKRYRVGASRLQVLNAGTMIVYTISCAQNFVGGTQSQSLNPFSHKLYPSPDADASEGRYYKCTFGDVGLETRMLRCRYQAILPTLSAQYVLYKTGLWRTVRFESTPLYHILLGWVQVLTFPRSIVRYHAIGWFKYIREFRGLPMSWHSRYEPQNGEGN
ncbi:hypothetical protein B0H19DRAFT_1243151 [Mycena capillaripes]|nr:hypothetical protein B0H19DRAFT_1243151 [Mycena capillaripes]